MASGVYAIVGPSGTYAGQSGWIKKRWYTHRRLLGENNHHSPYLQNAWNKHGETAFEFKVLFQSNDREIVTLIEQEWMDWYRKHEKCYNIAQFAGIPHTGNKSNLGLSRAKQFITIDGITKPLQTWCKENKIDPRLARIRIKRNGWSEEDAVTIFSKKYDSKSIEHAAKIREINKGRKHTAEARKNMGESHRGKHWNKAYRFITINGITKSLIEWCEENKISTQTARTRIRILGWKEEDAVSVASRQGKRPSL